MHARAPPEAEGPVMAKSKVRRVDYAPDEYIAGVGGVLRADEQGVYWMVCTLIMSEGHAIEYDARRLAALCVLRPTDVRKIIDRLVQRGKLTLQTDGKLTQNRAQSEVEKSLNRIQTAAENGSKGGRPSEKSKQNQQMEKPNGLSGEKTNKQQTTSNDQQEEETIVSFDQSPRAKRMAELDLEFSEKFWPAYPRKVSKGAAEKAYRAARKIATLDEIISGVNRYAKKRAGKEKEYTSYPATWLNAKGWTDDPEDSRDRQANGEPSRAFLFGRG